MKYDLELPVGFKSFRQGQEEAINQVLDYIDDGVQDIILNAPVGSGKSLMGYMVAKEVDSAYIATSTKYLQDQYLDSFPGIVTAKGRSNFTCIQDINVDCSYGVCQTLANVVCDHGVTPELELKNKKTPCPYWAQKVEAINAPISILNYKYLFTDKAYVHHFRHRKLAVFDEAHNLQKELFDFVDLHINPQIVKRQTNYVIKPKYNLKDWVGELENISYAYSVQAKKEDSKKKQDDFMGRSKVIEKTVRLICEDETNWVYAFDKRRGIYCFKPLYVDEYAQSLLNIGDVRLYMSGSILKNDFFAQELGLKDYESIYIPSTFPAENRPIVREYVGRMTAREIDNTFPKLISKINDLAAKHKKEKGIIHCFTYGIANRLKNIYGKDDRFIFHDKEDREDKTRFFKDSDEPLIFVSPYSYEGVDFPYDECRWAVICKDAYPSLSDPRIAARNRKNGDHFVLGERSQVLAQSYGRGNRAKDDYCVTYILDSFIDRTINAGFVNEYFLEAIVDSEDNKKIEVVDNLGLTTNERIIIDAINDEGLDTANKIIEAFKRIEGDSYQSVKLILNNLKAKGKIVFN